jgi:hypothetical protein
MMEGPCAESEEKHEPASDADAAVVDSLKALDLTRPIREADITGDLIRYGLTRNGIVAASRPIVAHAQHAGMPVAYTERLTLIRISGRVGCSLSGVKRSSYFIAAHRLLKINREL